MEVPQYEDYQHVPTVKESLIEDLRERWKKEDEKILQETNDDIQQLLLKKEAEIKRVCADYEAALKIVYANQQAKQIKLEHTRWTQLQTMNDQTQSWLCFWRSLFF